MSVCRVKVEARNFNLNASQEERDRVFRGMHAAFKDRVKAAGIISRYKEKQFFESNSEKRRRKEKAAELQRYKEKQELKARLREHFGR